MERLTYWSKEQQCYLTKEGLVDKADLLVEKLAKFEDFVDYLSERRVSIPKELESLRQADKQKTVTFKELLSEKLVTEMMINLMENHI